MSGGRDRLVRRPRRSRRVGRGLAGRVARGGWAHRAAVGSRLARRTAHGSPEPYAGPVERCRAAAGHGRSFVALAISYFLEGAGYIIAGPFLVAAVTATGPAWLSGSVWTIVGVAALPSCAGWLWQSGTSHGRGSRGRPGRCGWCRRWRPGPLAGRAGRPGRASRCPAGRRCAGRPQADRASRSSRCAGSPAQPLLRALAPLAEQPQERLPVRAADGAPGAVEGGGLGLAGPPPQPVFERVELALPRRSGGRRARRLRRASCCRSRRRCGWRSPSVPVRRAVPGRIPARRGGGGEESTSTSSGHGWTGWLCTGLPTLTGDEEKDSRVFLDRKKRFAARASERPLHDPAADGAAGARRRCGRDRRQRHVGHGRAGRHAPPGRPGAPMARDALELAAPVSRAWSDESVMHCSASSVCFCTSSRATRGRPEEMAQSTCRW